MSVTLQPGNILNFSERTQTEQRQKKIKKTLTAPHGFQFIILHIKTVFINLFSIKIKSEENQNTAEEAKINNRLMECTSLKKIKAPAGPTWGLYFNHSQIKHRFLYTHIYIKIFIYIYLYSFHIHLQAMTREDSLQNQVSCGSLNLQVNLVSG